MNKIESIIVGLCIGFVCPAFVFFACWWTAYLVLPPDAVPIAALSGLSVGMLLDIVFLRRWIRQVYNLHPALLMFLYLFFSAVVLLICMGVPVLNVILGIVAGAYAGRKLRHASVDTEQLRKGIKRVNMFATSVIIMVSLLSATAAIISSSTPSDLQGMFGLSFSVTQSMIVGLIIVGGFLLVVLQYWLTAAAAMVAYRIGGQTRPLNNA